MHNQEEICTYSVEHDALVNIYAFMISYAIFMHLGSEEEITLLEFDEVEEGDQQENPQVALPKAWSRILKSFRSVLTTAPLPFYEASPGAF